MSNRKLDFNPTTPIDFAKAIDIASLQDQSIIVTGGANGIGAAIVRQLAKARAIVTIVDFAEHNGKALAEELQNQDHRVQFVEANVTSFQSQLHAFRAALDFSGNNAVDIVITSAGLHANNIVDWLDSVPVDASDSEIQAHTNSVIDTNLTGTFISTQLALHFFRQLPTARAAVASKQIIFISSAAGYGDMWQEADYGAAKFGVRGLWRSIRTAGPILGDGRPPFRTNLIAPWFVRTQMTESVADFIISMGIPFADVKEVVESVLRCITDEEVRGRAVLAAPNGKSFDLHDDLESGDSTSQLLHHVKDGTIPLDLLQNLKG